MDDQNNIKVGIGFATGRKSFRKVLKSYIYNWQEAGLTENENVRLSLIAAYDLKYFNTSSADYTKVNPLQLALFDRAYFIGSKEIKNEINALVSQNVINEREVQLVFGRGYAAMRNIVLYTAIKHKMDYLLFLDDDEYPLAVTKTRTTAIWSGQHILSEHLAHIKQADITNGHHCGYISPVPYLEFNDQLTEDDFRVFIEAISNDIVNWETIQSVMKNGGVTYADTKILVCNTAEEVQEINHTKFISGANLCINLTEPTRVFPFYNPPNSRGEDTFLSTCLTDRKVLRIPTYAFHDGFSTYNHLLDGVLPVKLQYIKADSDAVVTRFLRACLGWIRYKPLLLYITQPNEYENLISGLREKLACTLPKISSFFNHPEFMKIATELESYHKNVAKHYAEFIETKTIWSRIIEHIGD